MYTDKAYLVKDRFSDKATKGSLSTLYRQYQETLEDESVIDLDVYPASYGMHTVLNMTTFNCMQEAFQYECIFRP